jgi:hypothetical protein
MDGIGNTEPWPCGLPRTKAGDISALRAGNVDFVFIKTHLCRIFRSNLDSRLSHASAG